MQVQNDCVDNDALNFYVIFITGGPFGTVISMPVTGWISASSIGWPSVFYIYGAVGFIWTACWVFIGCDKPSEHKSISSEEKKYIEVSLECDENKVSVLFCNCF